MHFNSSLTVVQKPAAPQIDYNYSGLIITTLDKKSHIITIYSSRNLDRASVHVFIIAWYTIKLPFWDLVKWSKPQSQSLSIFSGFSVLSAIRSHAWLSAQIWCFVRLLHDFSNLACKRYRQWYPSWFACVNNQWNIHKKIRISYNILFHGYERKTSCLAMAIHVLELTF